MYSVFIFQIFIFPGYFSRSNQKNHIPMEVIKQG